MSWVIDLCQARSSHHTADRGDIVADIRQLQSDVASLKRMWEHGATTSSDNAAGDTGTKRTKGHSVNVKVEADSPVLPAEAKGTEDEFASDVGGPSKQEEHGMNAEDRPPKYLRMFDGPRCSIVENGAASDVGLRWEQWLLLPP